MAPRGSLPYGRGACSGGGKGGAREGGHPGRQFAAGGILGAKILNFGICTAMC